MMTLRCATLAGLLPLQILAFNSSGVPTTFAHSNLTTYTSSMTQVRAQKIEVPYQSKCVSFTSPSLCFAINVPDMSGEEENLFMKISGPSSFKYAGIGFGSTGMLNTQMLLMFPIRGKVIANFRAGDSAQAHKRPTSIDGPKTEVLKSSNDGKTFDVEMRLINARHTQGRTPFDVADSKAKFIWAMGDVDAASAIGDDASKYITKYHFLRRGTFTLDLTQAKVAGIGGVPPTSGTK